MQRDKSLKPLRDKGTFVTFLQNAFVTKVTKRIWKEKERMGDLACAGGLYINANSGGAPGVVDAGCRPILDHSHMYSGVYGRAGITQKLWF